MAQTMHVGRTGDIAKSPDKSGFSEAQNWQAGEAQFFLSAS
jgi:hypothetical protein